MSTHAFILTQSNSIKLTGLFFADMVSNMDMQTDPRPSLHDYMKALEEPTKMTLAGDYFMLRMDGRAFHSFCRNMDKPFDRQLMDNMDATALALVDEISGAIAAYVQSDEISVLVKNPKTRDGKIVSWFGGEVVKMTTIAAARASVTLSRLYSDRNPALFDARAMEISEDDVALYLFWRQRDAMKNSVTMCAESVFGNKKLLHRNTDERREMLAEAGKPWEEAPAGFRYGRFALPVRKQGVISYVNKRTGEEVQAERSYLDWTVLPAPLFDRERSADLLRVLADLRSNGGDPASLLASVAFSDVEVPVQV